MVTLKTLAPNTNAPSPVCTARLIRTGVAVSAKIKPMPWLAALNNSSLTVCTRCSLIIAASYNKPG